MWPGRCQLACAEQKQRTNRNHPTEIPESFYDACVFGKTRSIYYVSNSICWEAKKQGDCANVHKSHAYCRATQTISALPFLRQNHRKIYTGVKKRRVGELDMRMSGEIDKAKFEEKWAFAKGNQTELTLKNDGLNLKARYVTQPKQTSKTKSIFCFVVVFIKNKKEKMNIINIEITPAYANGSIPNVTR